MSKRHGNRELGKVGDIFIGKEDYGIFTCSISIEFKGGGVQGFGGLCLNKDKLGISFVDDLCKTFGVKELDDLKDKECYALRCWDGFNDRIEGLESVDTGKRFIISNWRRKMGFESLSPLEERRKSLNTDIEFAKQKIERCKKELKNLEKNYTDWEK
jgi:hypothetical protein